MSVRFALLAGLAALGGCSEAAEDAPEQPSGTSGGSLESAAIDAGVVTDPESLDLTGLYQRRSGLGIDRMCALPDGEDRYRVGLLASFGGGIHCEGSGVARRGENGFEFQLGKGDCRFVVDFDGSELRVPGEIPAACSSFCDARASLAGVSIPLVDSDPDAARSAVDRDGKPLCTG